MKATRLWLLSIGALLLISLRLMTLAPDPWEWDEVLFTEAIRSGLDVRVNHPHAPGYPLFVELAMGITALHVPPFQAARLVGVVGSLLASGGVTWLLTGLGVSTGYSCYAAVLYALIPAVWLHGVRPVTDGCGAAAFLFAAGLLLRSRQRASGALLIGGAVVTAFAVGIRPQVGVALVPLAVGSAWSVFRRKGWVVALLLAASLFAAASLVIWMPLVRGSGGWTSYRARLKQQADYVRRVDARTPGDLLSVRPWARHFRDPFGRTEPLVATLFLGVAGLAFKRSRPKALAVVGIFAPLIGLHMLVAGDGQAPRYAAATLPALAALAGIGLEQVAESSGPWIAALAGTGLLAGLASTGAPAVLLIAGNPSPTVALASELRNNPRFRGRPIVFNGPLLVHLNVLVPDPARREFRSLEPLALHSGELVATADLALFGLEPARRFAFSAPWLDRIVGLPPRSTAIYDGVSGVGIVTASLAGAATADAASATIWLRTGASVALRAAGGPIRVVFRGAPESPEQVLLQLDANGASRRVRVEGKLPSSIEVVATPGPDESLLRISALSGVARLDGFHLSAPPSTLVGSREDATLPVAVDEPLEDAEVSGTLRVTGWCQEMGGGAIRPDEFRFDGVRVSGVEPRRTARPDVTAAIPRIGDAAHAGFEATLPVGELAEGRHRLTVSFITPDGRYRVYPPRHFVVRPR